jgi:hypothetical protein
VVEERGGEPFLLPIAGETERTAMALFHHDTPLETPITLRGSIGDSSCLRIRQQRLLPRVRRLDQQRAAMSVVRKLPGPTPGGPGENPIGHHLAAQWQRAAVAQLDLSDDESPRIPFGHTGAGVERGVGARE